MSDSLEGRAISQSNIAPHLEPLYEQVYKIFRLRIIGGVWKPEALLPGEIWLSQDMGVSVGTVRKAMDQLARENLVVRERGRGTFVRSNDDWQSLGRGLRLVDREGRSVAARIVLSSAQIADASDLETRVLKIRSVLSAIPRVLRLERHWMLGEAMLGTETSSVDASRFAKIAELLATHKDSLIAAYDKALRVHSDRDIWQLGAALPRGEAASTSGSSGLFRISYDPRGLPVELSQYTLCLDEHQLQLSRNMSYGLKLT